MANPCHQRNIYETILRHHDIDNCIVGRKGSLVLRVVTQDDPKRKCLFKTNSKTLGHLPKSANKHTNTIKNPFLKFEVPKDLV